MAEEPEKKQFIPRIIPPRELFAEGNRACQGCGEILGVRLVMKAAGPQTIVVSATGCLEIVSSSYPDTAWRVPWIHVAFENAAAVAAGVESGIKVLKRKHRYTDQKVNIIAIAGDGGTADIGIQALSGAVERGHDFTYVCTDNEAYMNTGIQRSSSTPYGASTTTSPAGKKSKGQNTPKKNMPIIMAAHEIPYVATACPSYPYDLLNKAKRAIAAEGPAYLHIFSPCPTGWRYPTDLTVEIGKLGVESGVFPLYEIIDGKLKLSVRLDKRRPVIDYLKTQGRFRHLQPEDLEKIQRRVDAGYQKLLRREECDSSKE